MSKILFTQESGGNLGHISKMLTIADFLSEKGYDCVFSSSNHMEDYSKLSKYPIYPAPTCSGKLEVKMTSYAHILAFLGFDTQQHIDYLLSSWIDLYKKISPDLVISNSAPSSVLAAKVCNIPVMRIDTGFGIPANESPFPNFVNHASERNVNRLEFESNILANINTVSNKDFKTLYEVFTTPADLLCTFEELDHYQRLNGKYIGNIEPTLETQNIHWPLNRSKNILVYLRNTSNALNILDKLVYLEANVIAYLPDTIVDSKLFPYNVRVTSEPVNIPELLKYTSLVISNGGHSLILECVRNKVPSLIIPTYTEQILTTFNVCKQNIGLGFHTQGMFSFYDKYNYLLYDESVKESLSNLAIKYQHFTSNLALNTIVSYIERGIK